MSSEVSASRPTGLVRAAYACAALVAVGCLAGVLLWARSGFTTPPQIFFLGPLPYLALIAVVVTQGSAGVLLTVRRPLNAVGWLILAFSGSIMLGVLADGYLALAESGWTGPLDPAWVALLPVAFAFGAGTTLSIAVGMFFPHGRMIGSIWRWGLWVAAVGGLAFTIGIVLTPGPVAIFPTYVNPVSTSIPPYVGSLLRVIIGPALLLAGVLATAAALVERYRASDEVGRLQIRWYAATGIWLAATFAAYLLAILVLEPSSPLGQAITILFFVSASIPPFALTFAILRYRLYDIDTLISRAVVYGVLTAILAGMYAASIRLFNAIFVQTTGESSELALVITTLILATTFTPIKSRLERAVSRRMGPVRISPEGPAMPVEAPILGDPRAVVEPRAPGDSAVSRAIVLADPVFLAALDDRIRAVAASDPSPGPKRSPPAVE